MDLHNILSQEAFWTVNKAIAKIVGVESALLLSDLVSKEKYFRDKNQIDNEGYFYNTTENIQDDTTLSVKVQKRCIDTLIKAGYIDYKLKGLPARKSFKINHENVLNELINIGKTRLAQTDKLANTNGLNKISPNGQTCFAKTVNNNKNKLNNNKLNENKEISLIAEVSTSAGVDDPNLAGNYPIEIINSTQGGGDVPEGFVIIWEKYDGKKKDLFTEWQRFSDKLEWQPDFNLILNKMPRGNKQPLQSWLNKYTSEPAKTRQIILDVYHNWYLSRNGVKPAINIVDAKGAGELAKYFEQIVKDKEPDLIMSNEDLEEKVEKAFTYILSKWNELDAFLQKQVRLQDIANNKTNIINYFKNGKQQTNSNSTAERIKAYKNGFDSIDERFANR